MQHDSLLSVREVSKTVSLSPSTVWDAVKRGTFPAPLKISERVTRWRNSDVQAWLKDPKLPKVKREARAATASESE